MKIKFADMGDKTDFLGPNHILFSSLAFITIAMIIISLILLLIFCDYYESASIYNHYSIHPVENSIKYKIFKISQLCFKSICKCFLNQTNTALLLSEKIVPDFWVRLLVGT